MSRAASPSRKDFTAWRVSRAHGTWRVPVSIFSGPLQHGRTTFCSGEDRRRLGAMPCCWRKSARSSPSPHFTVKTIAKCGPGCVLRKCARPRRACCG
jgi:hypothetical protein